MGTRVSYRGGGGRTGISPPSMSSPPQNFEVDIFLILSYSLAANFQPFWSPRSHQKQPQSMYETLGTQGAGNNMSSGPDDYRKQLQ